MKKEFTGPRSHKGWETLLYMYLQIIQLVLSDPERFLVNFLHLQADGFAC